MREHNRLGETPFKRTRRLKILIDKGEIRLAGNSKLKIYGKLNCQAGKRMKTANRVFFQSETEAKCLGYRPCGHCLHEDFLLWKASD